MDLYALERLRRELLDQIVKEKFTESFESDFLKLIDYSNFALMESEDNFFALFFVQIKRKVGHSDKAYINTIIQGEDIVMYFNPNMILECELREIQALIKHEIYHIISNHYYRYRALRLKYSDLAVSLAMDISINQYIMYLPSSMERLENVSLAYNVKLPEESTMEQYAELIQKAMDKLHKKPSKDEEASMESHELWNDINLEEYMEQSNEVVKRMAGNASKGKISENIASLLKALNQAPEVNWESKLQNMLGVLPAGRKKTVTRKNRRQPERLDLRGSLSNKVAKILIAIDISGSVTDKEIDSIMIEVLSLVKNYPFEITVVECDSIIQRIYKVKTIKDVRKKVESRGGTKYSPVFEYIYNERMRDYILIYFTDGMGEEKLSIKPYNYKTLWVLTGNDNRLSLEDSYGDIINIKKNIDKKEKVDVYELVRQEMKDISTLDWVAKGE